MKSFFGKASVGSALALVALIAVGSGSVAGCHDPDGAGNSTPAGGGGGSGGDGGSGGAGGDGGGPIGSLTFAASKTRDGALQVWIADADGKNAHPITETKSNDLPTNANDEPSLSPAGDRVLFASGRDSSSDGEGGDVANPTLRMLYTMKVDGSGAKRLTANDAQSTSEHDGRFSHDGKRVVFSMEGGDGPDSDISRIYVIDADGTHQKPLVPAGDGDGNLGQPIFTADDKAVVFRNIDGDAHGEVQSVDIATGAVKTLTHLAPRAASGWPMLSGDGKRVLFLTGPAFDPGGEIRMESVALDGTDPQTLFTVPAITSPPDFAGTPKFDQFALSHDGSTFIFVAYAKASNAGSTFTLDTSKLDGSAVTVEGAPLPQLTAPFWR